MESQLTAHEPSESVVVMPPPDETRMLDLMSDLR